MTALGARDCAVVLIDLQVSSVAATSTRPLTQVRAAAGALAELAQVWQMPLLITTGRKSGPGAALISELRAAASECPVIQRSTVDAFDTPDFVDAVAALKRSTLLMAGVALDIGVTSAALSARAHDYQVYVVAEACATTDALAEATALSRLAAANAHWIGFAAVSLDLMKDFGAPRARATQALIQRVNPNHAKAHP